MGRARSKLDQTTKPIRAFAAAYRSVRAPVTAMASLRIAHAYNIGTAVVMKSVLESEGIEVLEIGRAGHLSIAGADQGFYVEVVLGQRRQACQILRDHELGKYLLSDAP